MESKHLISPSPRRPTVAKNHRAGPRVIVNGRAVLLMPRTGKPHPVLLHNVSIGGACVQTDANLLAGDDIRLHIDVGLAEKLILDAIVIAIRPRPKRFYTEYGLRFVGLEPGVQATLQAYIRLRARP